jgi:hypothetical protein
MGLLLLIAAVLGLGDLLIAVAAWRVCSRVAKRPRAAWAAGGLLGAAGGALLALPQLELVVEQLGFRSEAAGLAIAFTYPFSLPAMTGLGAWLVAETTGGRSAKPWRAALCSCGGALVGAALFFVALFFTPVAHKLELSRNVYQLMALSMTSAGSLAGLSLEKRREPKLRAEPARS